MWAQERLFDVEAILEEQEGGLAAILGKCRGDKIDSCRWNVGNVFGAEDDIVVWRYAFFYEVGDGVANLVMLDASEMA
jgi:hypothetical protein